MKELKVQKYYEAAVADLENYCERECELVPDVRCDSYPFRVSFLPSPQMSLFDDGNVDENGEICEMIVTVGLAVTVKSTLEFKMESGKLRKLIRLAEKLGHLYYQAFREAADGEEEENNDEGCTSEHSPEVVRAHSIGREND